MEKFNINFNGGDNTMKTICWILSLLSWLLLIVTGIIGFVDLFDYNFIWIIRKWDTSGDSISIINFLKYLFFYVPMQVCDVILIIIFILVLIFIVLGFLLYVYYCTFGKNNSIMEGMLGPIPRFHFIPLVCASALFLIGITEHKVDEYKNILITSLIFSILGLVTCAFIAFKSNLESGPWYATFIIKKGVYGSFIALFTYNICYSIFLMGIINEDILKKSDFRKNCGIGFSISIGIVNLALSFVLKDVVIATMNLLIYLGATIYYFNINSNIRDYFNSNADGIIEIVMLVLSAVVIGFLVYQNKGLVANK